MCESVKNNARRQWSVKAIYLYALGGGNRTSVLSEFLSLLLAPPLFIINNTRVSAARARAMLICVFFVAVDIALIADDSIFSIKLGLSFFYFVLIYFYKYR